MSDNEREGLNQSVQPLRVLLAKVRTAAFALKNSPTILPPKWFLILQELKLPGRMMPRDVSTWWNSTYDMLVFAITGDCQAKIQQYELSEDDWVLVKQLRDVLLILKDTTLFFSRKTPNLATVIPAMDHIDKYLATAATSKWYHPAIKAVLAIGKRTSNRYYDKTDYSEVYRVAMSAYIFTTTAKDHKKTGLQPWLCYGLA
ncbi:hypothetical protein FPV67DRAFT_1561940 [Lyophyllum atratum]|nr:hypothetical protein FPV67DRAFT_1561940 [Lyophyllum atratum]